MSKTKEVNRSRFNSKPSFSFPKNKKAKNIPQPKIKQKLFLIAIIILMMALTFFLTKTPLTGLTVFVPDINNATISNPDSNNLVPEKVISEENKKINVSDLSEKNKPDPLDLNPLDLTEEKITDNLTTIRQPSKELLLKPNNHQNIIPEDSEKELVSGSIILTPKISENKPLSHGNAFTIAESSGATYSNMSQQDSLKITSPNNLSYNISSSNFINGVFLSYNGTNTSQRPFGKLIDDFTVLDFYFYQYSTNTLADIYLTDQGYILNGLNVSYTYANSETDWFNLRKDFASIGQGISILPYDSLGFKVKVDVSGRHMFKFRIYTQNVSNPAQEVSCDTAYRSVTGTIWTDFTASINDFSGDDCDYTNMHALSIMFNDQTDSTTGSGNILVDELYLRSNTEYYLDDFDYYKTSNTPHWATASTGDNDSAAYSITSSVAYNSTQSLKIIYNYSDESADYINVRNGMPFNLSYNDYDQIGFWFKADQANYHQLKARAYEDNRSNYCDTGYTTATTTDWQLFEWNISDFDSNCNLSIISGVSFQLNDLNNSDSGTGTVYLDNYYLKTNSISQKIDFNFINESILSNSTISWSICINSSLGVDCSSSNSFDYTEYAYDSSSSFRTESGNLTDKINGSNYLQENSQTFVRANKQERAILSNVLLSLKNLDYQAAIINASAVNYTITNYTHNLTDNTYYVVENSTANKGWGYFVFNPSATITDLFISVPHPLNDGNTPEVGTNTYLNVSTRWLFVSSAHRNTNFNQVAEPISDNNRYHPYYEAMVNLTNASTDWLEIHGFASSSHPGYPNATLSYGNSTQTNISLSLAANLTAVEIDAGVYNGTNYPNLAATRNLIGKYIRSISADFISAELSEYIRNNNDGAINFMIAVTNTWNPVSSQPDPPPGPPPDTTPPSISEIGVASITINSASIIWTTDENSDASVNYGITTSLGNSATDVSFGTSQSVPLSGLNSATTYYYNITSCDSNGNCVTTGPFDFTTNTEYFFAINLPSTERPVLFENTGTSAKTNGQAKNSLVRILLGAAESSSGDYSGSMWVNFTQNISLSSITLLTDRTSAKAVFHNSSALPQVMNRSLLVPKVSGAGEVFICPGASALDKVTINCADKVTIGVGQTSGGMTVSEITKDSENYYLIDGITGTGGGEGSAPTLTNGNVTPLSGATSTSFFFNVTYTDAENDTASYVKVEIDGVNYTMGEFDANDLDVTDGKTYNYSTTLSVSSHSFKFWAADQANVIANTLTYSGPVVINKASITGASVTKGGSGRIITTNASYDNAQGGNVTEMNLSSSASTVKWQGYYGQVSADLNLGIGSNNLFSFGNATNDQIKTVFSSPDAAFDFSQLQVATAASVDSAWSFPATDADSTNSTFNNTAVIAHLIDVPAANLNAYTSLGIQNNSIYLSGIFTDQVSPSIILDFAFGSSVVVDQKDFRNVSPVDYELLVPVNTSGLGGTQTYYFFLDIE
ncbi:MAG: hypothetical protein KJ597_01615 [Nanoarchaeota archaeon]|nr:hypothetical protein [Nanoarchaeota archaeon]MBU1622250.1 hypothetical protein [Nanoarchaeota archaeon]